MTAQEAGRMLRGEMPKAYDPRAVESGIYEFWESQGFFSPSTTEAQSEPGAPNDEGKS